MAQVRLLKVSSSGFPQEHAKGDDVTFNSYQTSGGGVTINDNNIFITSGGTGNIYGPFTSGTSIINKDYVDSLVSATSGGADLTAGPGIDINTGISPNVISTSITSSAVSLGSDNSSLTLSGNTNLDILSTDINIGAPTASTIDIGQTGLGNTIVLRSSAEGGVELEAEPTYESVSPGTADDVDVASVGYVRDAVNTPTEAWTADEVLLQYDAVYVTSDDSVSKTVSTTFNSALLVGFTLTAAASGSQVPVQSDGIVKGILAGAIAGDEYFLDPDNNGLLTTAIPTDSGDVVYFVGVAKNTTDLVMTPQFIARRA